MPAVAEFPVVGRVSLAAVVLQFAHLPGGDAVAVEFHPAAGLFRQRKHLGILREQEAVENNMVAGIHPLENHELMDIIGQVLPQADRLPPGIGEKDFPLHSIQNDTNGIFIIAVQIFDIQGHCRPPEPQLHIGAGIDKHRGLRLLKINSPHVLQQRIIGGNPPETI